MSQCSLSKQLSHHKCHVTCELRQCLRHWRWWWWILQCGCISKKPSTVNHRGEKKYKRSKVKGNTDADVRNHQLLITGKTRKRSKVRALSSPSGLGRILIETLCAIFADVPATWLEKTSWRRAREPASRFQFATWRWTTTTWSKHLPVSAVQTGQPHRRGTRSMRHARDAPLIFCCPRALLLMSSSLSSLLPPAPLPHRSAHLSLHHSARRLTRPSSSYLC